MPPLPASVGTAPSCENLRAHHALLNHRIAQLLGDASAWSLSGVRWMLQRFYYHVETGDGCSLSMHRHDWFELTLVVQGQVRYSTRGHSKTLTRGDLFFIAPSEAHQWQAVKSPLVLASFQFRLTALTTTGERLIQGMNEMSQLGLFSLRKPSLLGKLHQASWRLLQNPPTPLLADKLLLDFHRFAVEFSELALARFLPATLPVPTAAPERHASVKNEQIIEFVRNNLHQSITQEDIARHFHYSVRQLARQFHKENGIALGHYIVEQKLQQAQRLLATTDQSIKEIALGLGYVSISYFCRLFQKYIGITPSFSRSLAQARRYGSG